ncbi:MAG: hypothetical protein ACI8SJ_002674 [Shewanella sp.]|jgi:hypothetical protein
MGLASALNYDSKTCSTNIALNIYLIRLLLKTLYICSINVHYFGLPIYPNHFKLFDSNTADTLIFNVLITFYNLV